MVFAEYTLTVGALTFKHDQNALIGFETTDRGSKALQEARFTISNIDGTIWTDDIQELEDVEFSIGGVVVFDGFATRMTATGGNPGAIVLECKGHSLEMKASPVRPLVYSDELTATQRDGSAVQALVSGGVITLPQDARHVPIHELYAVEVGGVALTVLNLDAEAGLIWVDEKHNGQLASVEYSCFKSIYENVAAETILLDLFNRHAISHLQAPVIASTTTTLTFEPSPSSDLFTEWGRIQNELSNQHYFFVDTDHTPRWVARSVASVQTLDRIADRFREPTSFEADYEAYANVVTVKASAGKTNSIAQTRGVFTNTIEGLNPTGSQVDSVAQGFKALDKDLLGFRVLATRQTESAALGWEIQYNGKRAAIVEPFTASHSLTPDAVNITLDATNDRIHVKSAGVGTAYFSNQWQQDLTQNTGANDATTADAWQSITVSGLTRTSIKGIAFKTPAGSGQVKFEVRAGDTGSGSVLGTSETVDLATTNRTHETGWYSVYFTTAVDVSAQTNITINKVNVAGTPAWTKDAGGNPYAGGRASTDANDDFVFQLFTVQTIQEALLGLARIVDTVTDTAKTPLYYVARDYTIGQPAAATWVQVLTNTARFMAGATTDRFGIKIEFNSASLTSDPLVSSVRGSVAYADPEDALDEPCGIVRGRLSGSATADVLPFFNPTSGTFTQRVEPSAETRLEKNGNYWLVLDDDAPGNSIAWFKVFYDDGADGVVSETWADQSRVDVNSNVTVANGQAGLTRNTTVGRIETTNIVTTVGTITDATIIQTKAERQGVVFPLLSRNKRNYYHPFKSTNTANPAVYTGELCILQFDTGDVTESGGGSVTIADVSGNGYNASSADLSNWSASTGKHGGGWSTGSAVSEGVFVLEAGEYLMGDMSVSLWYKPTAAVADDKVIFAIDDGTRRNIRLVTRASGAVRYSHTHGNGSGTETVTSTATPLANGVWTHILVSRDFSTKELKIYLDKVIDTTTTLTNDPDIPPGKAGTNSGCPTFAPPTSGGLHAGAASDFDECRLWARVVEDWVVPLVADSPYTTGVGKFTFPVEADATDDYTDSNAADGVKDDLRLIEFYWPAPFYEDGIMLRTPFDYGQFPSTIPTLSDAWDMSSYAQQIDSLFVSPSAPTLVTVGASHGTQADFNGSTQAVPFANSDSLQFDGSWSILVYLTHDVTATTQTVFHKRGQIKVELQATSVSASTLTVTLSLPNAATRIATFTGLGIGTTQRHVGITYDQQILRVYVDASLANSNDFGSAAASAISTNAFVVGAENTTGTTLANWFDGKMEELVILDYAISASDLSNIRRDKTIGQRGPTEQGYVASAYAGAPTKAYAAGKYLVTRDDADSWVDTLDGSTGNASGSLAFKMDFGKDSLVVVRRNQAEIDRLGFEVHDTFEIAATDQETLKTAADGFLAIVKDGLERGQVVLDGTTARSVGDRVTINYPEKGQVNKEYNIAAISQKGAEGRWTTTYQLGEEPRTWATVLKGKEIGIS